MRMDKLTSKFQLAFQNAQSLALGRDHQFIEPAHLMVAMLDQDGSGVRSLLVQAGVNVSGGGALAPLHRRSPATGQMEIDSKPEALDRLERRLIQPKIEREALIKETDEASLRRLVDLEETWNAEKASVHGTNIVKEELERVRQELETARRAGDLGRMSELQ